MQEELTETDLDKAVNIRLSETDTIWLIDMRGVCISAETDEAETIKAKNEAYKEVNNVGVHCAFSLPYEPTDTLWQTSGSIHWYMIRLNCFKLNVTIGSSYSRSIQLPNQKLGIYQ